jgi:hypothetical protein
MTMEYKTLDDGGHSWEWTVQRLRFQAVAVGGSPDVALYYREADNTEASWELHHRRAIGHGNARAVAAELYRETALAPLNITTRLRVKRHWPISFGEHEGKYGVGLEVLYLTPDELDQLLAALGEVD